MANLNVQRKTPSVWPILIGLLLLGLLAWGALSFFDGNQRVETVETTTGLLEEEEREPVLFV